MPSSPSPLPSSSWDEPEGLAARGTLIVLAGRGEHGGVYERFGRRLAFDAYRVRALGDASADPSVLDEAAKLLADESLPGPKVLVGSDTGARYAARLAAEQTAGAQPSGTGDVRQQPVEDSPAFGILVEALVDEVADGPAGLRTSPSVGMVDGAGRLRTAPSTTTSSPTRPTRGPRP